MRDDHTPIEHRPIEHTSDNLGALPPGRVREVALVFLRLGVTAFGGPAAHIAAMEDLLVHRRQWVTRSEFMDLLSAANVIPGPNSTELAIHLGYRRAGWRGLVAAGLAFIVPASVFVWIIAMLYVQHGRRPEVTAFIAGMQPVVLAVVVQALWRLGRSVLRTWLLTGIAVASTSAVLLGLHELVVLGMAAVVGLVIAGPSDAVAVDPERSADHTTDKSADREKRAPDGARLAFPSLLTPAFTSALTAAAAPTTLGVFGAFLKIGSVLFGSGYVLLAFLRAEFVVRHGWLTESQLLDAIAVGQITPGPVFTSATFVGYLLAGHQGAVAASVGIFLPAFLFVALSGPLVRHVRSSRRASSALDAVNAASLALMAAVSLVMLRPIAASLADMLVFALAAALLIRTNIGAGWMLLGGAVVGVLRLLLR